jgi:hypothetical protein
MEATEMYKNKAVIFDPNEYPGGWENLQTQEAFIAKAVEHCDGFLPDDWYLDEPQMINDEPARWITVYLKRYADGQNLQTYWVFQLLGDPVDDLDNQWITFNVTRYEYETYYRFNGFLPWTVE